MNDLIVLLALFLIGFFLIFLEAVIIPGFGVPGILGILAIVAAAYHAFSLFSVNVAVLICVAGALLLFLLLRLLSRSGLWKQMNLSTKEGAQEGFTVADATLKTLLNKTGTAFTLLRPSGTVLIENQRYDAMTDGDFIQKDEPIRVYGISGTTLVVRRRTADGDPADAGQP